MRFAKKTLVASTLVVSFSTLGLSGCSTISNLFGSDDSYRDSEIKTVKSLEMPPNLFNPGKKDKALSSSLFNAEKSIARQTVNPAAEIPTFQAEGIAIKSNLSERWIEFKTLDSGDIWHGLRRFFNNEGFDIAEERKDIGVIETSYIDRQEQAPVEKYAGTLTNLFNAWRPEMAKGAFDKYVARVETDKAQGVVRVYINHHQMIEPVNRNDSLGEAAWRVRPYSPVMEAIELYKAMVFFGSTEEQAATQLAATEHQVEVAEGEEFAGLLYQVSSSQTWEYLQAMIYRANWGVDKVEAAKKSVIVNVPDSVRDNPGLLGSLAFWRDRKPSDLPEQLKLTVSTQDDSASIIEVSVLEGEKPLYASQRKYVFESLGLLAK